MPLEPTHEDRWLVGSNDVFSPSVADDEVDSRANRPAPTPKRKPGVHVGAKNFDFTAVSLVVDMPTKTMINQVHVANARVSFPPHRLSNGWTNG